MINNNKKKKVIIFNPSIEDGGVEKNLYIIANYLVKKKVQIDLISSDISKKNKFHSKINFIHSNYFVKKNSSRYIKYISCLVTLIKKIYKDRKCLILAFQANIYAIIICWLLNIKIIARLNTAPQGWDHNYLKNKIYSYFIKKADIVVVNSSYFKKEVDKRYDINSLLIHNPFEFSKIKKLSLKKIKYNFDKNKTNLINVGRMTEQKDQMTLIKSLTKIHNKDKVMLTIIGKGTKKKELIEFAKNNNLEENVNFLNYQNNPYPYINAADIFVLSSKFEGSPNVLIEAQIFNKYIFSTNCPTGPKEILKNYKKSKLFNVGDYKKLAILINNFKKKTFIKNNYFFPGLKKYDKEYNCKKYLNIIQNLN